MSRDIHARYVFRHFGIDYTTYSIIFFDIYVKHPQQKHMYFINNLLLIKIFLNIMFFVGENNITQDNLNLKPLMFAI